MNRLATCWASEFSATGTAFYSVGAISASRPVGITLAPCRELEFPPTGVTLYSIGWVSPQNQPNLQKSVSRYECGVWGGVVSGWIRVQKEKAGIYKNFSHFRMP